MTTASEQVGRSARQRAPRSAHAAWEAAPDRVDAIATLEHQAETRMPELLPIRYGRMARLAVRVPPRVRGRHGGRSRRHARHRPAVCSCAATPTWQLRHLRRTGPRASSSTSTTSTRRSRARSNGTSSGWRRASRSRARSRLRRDGAARVVAAGGAGLPRGDARVRRDAHARRLVRAHRRRATLGRSGPAPDARRRRQRRPTRSPRPRRKDSLRALAKLTERSTARPASSRPAVARPARGARWRRDAAPDLRAAGGLPAALPPRCRPTAAQPARPLPSSSTSRARSSASAASARAPGSCCCSGATTPTRSFLQVKEAQPSVLEPFAQPQPSTQPGPARRARASG